MLEAVCYSHVIKGKNMTTIKRKASRIANMYYNSVDMLHIWTPDGLLPLVRRNKKTPNNTIMRGKWR